MLESLFANPSTRQSLRASPLGPYLDAFSRSLLELGYAASTARRHVRLTAEVGRRLAEREIAAADLAEEVVEGFVRERGNEDLVGRGLRPALLRFVEHLRGAGELGAVPAVREQSPPGGLEGRYESHLRRERGLAAKTAAGYRFFVRRFVRDRFGAGPLQFDELVLSDISGFVVRHAPTMSRARAKLMVTALRSFLRYLLQQGEIDSDLAASVPTVAHWRRSNVPKYLPLEQVERLLASCDRSRRAGRRDYAILLLLARLGLRAGEVVSLELEDIDWRGGRIRVRGKGLVRQRLPLPVEVGEAVAEYLSRDRPRSETRRVFVRTKAPRGGLAGPGAVSMIVRRALKRAGLRPPLKGAHLLRHSLATGLLRRGASMAEIAQVLRHRSSATTEIYAKVDLDGLRSLARPWPGKGGEQ